MEEINKCITESLDASDVELLPYLPYILQDLWDFGADPVTMLSLIKQNIEKKNLRILDLGCGKGAVSITIAKELQCTISGIDGIPEFIESAKEYAVIHKVNKKCDFEVGDIREKIKKLSGFDVIILGAIGPVFGNLYETLIKLSNVLYANGYVLLDDGYIKDESAIEYNRCLRKSDFYGQIEGAGFDVVQEAISEKNTIEDTDKSMYEPIEIRVNELVIQYPDKKEMFLGYLKSQEYENNMLENELVTGTWLLKLRK